VMFRAWSMMFNPSSICSSVMHSGGTINIIFALMKVKRPFSRRYFPFSCL
jgi:hypothetical protein